MTREEIYDEITQVFGLVPMMFKALPDTMFELEWKLFRASMLDEGPIPNKFRELIALGVSASNFCKYCAFYHTEVAKLFGATDEEIENAVDIAKVSVGWSAYINGSQMDFEDFKSEITAACDHIRSTSAAQAEQA